MFTKTAPGCVPGPAHIMIKIVAVKWKVLNERTLSLSSCHHNLSILMHFHCQHVSWSSLINRFLSYQLCNQVPLDRKQKQGWRCLKGLLSLKYFHFYNLLIPHSTTHSSTNFLIKDVVNFYWIPDTDQCEYNKEWVSFPQVIGIIWEKADRPILMYNAGL